MADKVLLEIVDHADSLVEDLLILAAGEQDILRTEHLRNLGEDRGAAESDQSVGETSDGRVGRDAGEAVGAAALHADNQLRCRDRLTLELGGILRKLMDNLAALLYFIFDVLAGQELHALRIILAETLEEEVHREVLAAEGETEDAARVRMMDQCGQKLSGLLKVAAQLAAAERMSPEIEAVDRALDHILVLLHDLFCDAVHAADDRDDPDLIADRGAAVFSPVAHEGLRSDFRKRIDLMVIDVLGALGEACLYVVGVYPVTLLDVLLGDGDRIAVLDDRIAGLDVKKRDLVAAHDVFICRDGNAVDGELRSGLDLLEGNRNDVRRMNSDEFHTLLLLKERAQ